jgi:hypothetical protein
MSSKFFEQSGDDSDSFDISTSSSSSSSAAGGFNELSSTVTKLDKAAWRSVIKHLEDM